MRPNVSHLVLVALSCLSSSRSAAAFSVKSRATTCNGQTELCDRSYGNVTFVGAHDSYAVGTNNLAANQDYDVTQQLNDGIRMLQMQAHMSNNSIHLCHTSCLLYDAGTLESYFDKVKTWMDANPNDVVSMLIVNSEGIDPTSYASVFQATGLDTLSYAPSSSSLTFSNWPTLGTLIDDGKRLVTFMDTGADFTSVPYIIDEFSNVWETAFDVTDPTFDCNVNRTHGDSTTQMYLINHFLDEVVSVIATSVAPNKGQLNVTNAVSGTGSLGLQASECAAQEGRNPNFMLVDFYEYGGGSVFQVAADLNGVTYNPTSPIATPLPDTSSTSSGTSDAMTLHDLRVSGTAGWLVVMMIGAVAGAWTAI